MIKIETQNIKDIIKDNFNVNLKVISKLNIMDNFIQTIQHQRVVTYAV